MNHNIQRAIQDLHGGVNRPSFLHPSVSIVLTLIYVVCVTSLSIYNVVGLLQMFLFVFILFEMHDLSFVAIFVRLRVVWALLFLLGIANVFIDRSIVIYWLGIPMSGGVLSFMTLYLKEFLCVSACWAMVQIHGMENLCYGMQKLHVPRVLIVVIMLIDRYLIQLLKEVQRSSIAYSFRAPNQKGIQSRAWGSFVGSILLRSIDRAQILYESMCLRAFHGEFYLRNSSVNTKQSIFYFVGMIFFVLVLRFIPVFSWVGGLL